MKLWNLFQHIGYVCAGLFLAAVGILLAVFAMILMLVIFHWIFDLYFLFVDMTL